MTDYQHATADSSDLRPQLNALLGEGVVSAVLFSSDGLALAATDGLGRDEVERSCAAFASVASLQHTFADCCRTDPGNLLMRYQIMDFTNYTVLLMSAGANSGLGVAVEGDSISQNVQLALSKALKLIKALGPFLAARERQILARA
ncbi:roadblock/LC7 domain-containing protein [Yinghuangia sp. YIM S09857]|uniref:roadblock/LC7 domain-containing protein n=1 Tax=Yinghuangia sp. YIM S09857 TaxID=3436929 RepID=UPI003F5346E2